MNNFFGPSASTESTSNHPLPPEPHMVPSVSFVARAIAAWVGAASRWSILVLLVSVALTIGAGVYVSRDLALNSGTEALLSPDLPYQRDADVLKQAFPMLSGVLVIIVDGDTAERTDAAADALTQRLRADHSHFTSVFYPQGDPFFRRNGLLFLSTSELEDLVDQLSGAQPLLANLAQDMNLRGLMRVLTLATQAIADGHADPAMLMPAFKAISGAIEAERTHPGTRLSWQELIGGEASTAAEKRRIIVVQPVLDHTSLEPAEEALASLRATIVDLSLDQAHGVHIQLTGDVAIDEDELASVKEGATTASLICFVLVGIVAFSGLRSAKLVLATMLPLAMSLVWTAAFAALAIGHLNLISVGFGVLFIGMAVDFTLQFVLRFREEIQLGNPLRAALRAAGQGSGIAVATAAICAAIGFLSFAPTDYLGLAELGIISGVGMIIGLITTLTLVPALITLLAPRIAVRSSVAVSEHRIGEWIIRDPRRIVAGAIVAGLAALVALPLVRFDIDPLNLKDPNSPSVQAFRHLAGKDGAPPYTINILAKDQVAATALAHKLDALPEVARTETIDSFVPTDQDSKLAIVDQLALILSPVVDVTSDPVAPPTATELRAAIEAFLQSVATMLESGRAGALTDPAKTLSALLAPYASTDGLDQSARLDTLQTTLLANLPSQLNALREALQARPITVNDLPRDLRDRYVAPDGRARVEVFPKEPLTDQASLQRFVDAVRAVGPQATDTPVLLLEVGKTMVGAFYQGGFYALGMISILLIVILRSLRDTVLVLLPLLLAALLTTATMVVFDIPFNFANIIAMPLLFSLGVAFGIYLVMRDREAESVVALMHTCTPRAVIFSAMTTMVSFGALMVSPHRGMASMGELLAIALTFALICTLIVLPALFAWRELGWKLKRKP